MLRRQRAGNECTTYVCVISLPTESKLIKLVENTFFRQLDKIDELKILEYF